ncbi:E3 ubiquitin-protein ligase msl-2 [Stomoxys calcitrans]|uniref:E3 ubiquitin-protein ligase msl-2 n=1 Tax=Stomoxys calcitrans TaxID=35570 RepID=UPI0027E269D8|nr:E3 ubiquitin-protein ligase msl-2 [Stomoxys calcitrans]
MNAVTVYVNAAKLVLQSTESTNISSNNELPRQLLSLRQLLSCVVCCRLANDPYSPNHGHCNHTVCRLCVRGQKNLHPSCAHCRDNRDFKTYDENKQLRCLLVCYKSLCEHLRSSSVFPLLAGRKLLQYNVMTPVLSMPQMSLQDLIVEGASYDDILSTFTKDLPKPPACVYTPPPKQQPQQPQMPALVVPLSTTAATPLAPLTQNIKSSGISQAAPKAATPPTSASGPISSLPLTHVPKVKVETSTPAFKSLSQTVAPPSVTNAVPVSQQSTTTYSHPHLIQLNQLKNAGNITYIGPNTRGIVVPIVSSSGTTAVPLSIASARLLNRQLAQAREPTSVSSSSIEPRPQLTTFKVSLAPTQPTKTVSTSLNSTAFNSSTSLANSVSTATVTSQMRNPPPIKTVSNGSAMYSVLYTGIGNKITIKRKTDGDEDATQKRTTATLAPNTATLLRPLAKNNNKKRGCRCGNTTTTPGKLTCCGQRCPCYVDSKSCIGCKCRGCRNPHRADGMKVRPVIPELACYEIQMADDNGNVNELPIATTSGRLAPHNGDSSGDISMQSERLDIKPSVVVSGPSSLEGTTHLMHRSLQQTPRSSPLSNMTTSTVSVSRTQSSIGSSSSAATSTVTTPGNIVQLDQMQRESLLIQNAEGKFQVVNLFTTGTGQSNQVPGLQRLQTLPQTVVSVSGSNNFILPATISTTAAQTNTNILQSQHQLFHSQQQHQQQQQAQHQQQQIQHIHQPLSAQRIANTTLPLQFQQQLKQNIITVHAHTIGTNATANTSPATASVLTPSSSPAPTTATLTLAPLVINNTQNQTSTTTEMLEDTTDMGQRYTNIIVSSSSSATSINSGTTNSTVRDVVSSMPVVSLSSSINLKALDSSNV